MRKLILLIAIGFCSCSDQVETVTIDQNDSTAKTLNRSQIINDSSRLPNDSTNTGVQH